MVAPTNKASAADADAGSISGTTPSRMKDDTISHYSYKGKGEPIRLEERIAGGHLGRQPPDAADSTPPLL